MSLYKSIPHTFRKEGIYYFNRRVPKDVRSSYNKSRISFSSLVGLGPSSSSLNLFPSDNPFVLVKTSYLSHLLSSYKFVRSSLVNGYQVKINLACQNNHIICKPFNYRFLIRCMYNFYKPKKKGTRKLIVHLPIFFSSTAIFFFSFFSWRLAFQQGDWSVLFLIPLTLLLFGGSYKLSLDNWKAKFDLTVKKESKFYSILTGKITATIIGVIFSFSSITILAWQTLQASNIKLTMMAFFAVATNIIYLFLRDYITKHFHDPFDRNISVRITTLAVSVVCFLSLWYTAYYHETYSGKLITANFDQAIEIGFSQVPNQESLFANFLAIPFVHETLKVWGLIQLKDSYQSLIRPISLIMCLDAALISFLLVRANVILVQLIQVTKTLRDIS